MAGEQLLQSISNRRQAVAYMYPELRPGFEPDPEDVFVFQYWPSELADSYSTGWVDKPIPGGAGGPIQQFVGGSPRTLSFTLVFTAEVLDPGLPGRGIPSSRYTVDLESARQRIRKYQHPTYRAGGAIGVIEHPPLLNLVFPGMYLGHSKEPVLVTLREASFNTLKWFPDGRPRIMTASLSFQESIQFLSDQGPAVRFVGSDAFIVADAYNFNDGGQEGLIGGS